MWLYSRLFVENVRLQTVDAPLTLILMMYQQLVDADQFSAEMHTVVIGSQ